jgi:tetratricopeptide (TPR) repeat protein
MSEHLHRALLLLGRSRYDLAEREIRQELAEYPDSPEAHSVLASIMAETDRPDEAMEEANRAVGLGPDVPYCHFVRALVLNIREKYSAAADAAREAIRLDPDDADFHGALAMVRLNQSKWQAALDAAEQGLRCDPEDVDCQNARSTALMHLGRMEEAEAVSRQALADNPESARAHAVSGWALLKAGNHREAQERFRESLRLNPNLEHARAGMVEALKARSFVYRLLLRYLFWLNSLGRKQWIFIVGLVVGINVFRRVSERVPALRPWTMPVLYTYLGFVLFSWLAGPLSNLLLMVSRFGRLTLNSRQRRASMALAGCLVVAVLGFALGWYWDRFAVTCVGVLGLTIAMPAVASLNCRKGRRRLILGGYTLALLALGVVTIAMMFLEVGPVVTMIWIYVIAWAASSWLGNLIRK